MLTKRSHAAVAVLLLLVLVAACGGSAPTASGTPSPQPTAIPSGTRPSQGVVAELEALIPDQIGGISLSKYSMKGDAFVSSGGAPPEARDFLEGLGVSTDDVAVAFGFGQSTETDDGVAVFVFRALGAGSDRLVSGFMEATNATRDAPLDWQPTTVGGKGVYRATDPEQNNQTVYLYAVDDTLYFLAATQEQHAEEALAALP